MAITITLDHHEALMILDPIQDGAQADRITAATADGDTAEWHGIRAQVRQRIAAQIVDALYPEPTRLDRIGRDEFAAELEFGMA